MAEIQQEEIKRTIFDSTVESMKSLGVYRSEYNGTISTYADICEQYLRLTDRFKRSKYKIQTQSAQGGMKKAPIVSTLESLRKDMLMYSDRLCLNPKSFDAMTIKPQPKQSKLDKALDEL